MTRNKLRAMSILGCYATTRAAATGYPRHAGSVAFMAGWRLQNSGGRITNPIRRFSAAAQEPNNNNNNQRIFPEELNIIYDSKCNVCQWEMSFLERRDAKLALQLNRPRRLKLTDLEHPNYSSKDPANGGVTYEQGMKAMHAVAKDGRVIQGVPVFRIAYEQVNLGWLFAVTQVPWMNRLLEAAYNIFAKYRTHVTRGASVDALVQAYEEKRALQQRQQQQLDDCDACRK